MAYSGAAKADRTSPLRAVVAQVRVPIEGTSASAERLQLECGHLVPLLAAPT